MRVVISTPLIDDEDLGSVAKKFFEQIGYLPKGSDSMIPYKIFLDFFLKHPTKAWFVDKIADELKTSRPTVYRHLNKLKGFGILEEVRVFDDVTKQNKKAYRMRYGDFQRAWDIVEVQIKAAVENYGKTVEHLQKLLEKQREGLNE